MLDLALKAIATQLNHHIAQEFDLDEDVVVLSAPFDADGSIASQVNNKLVIFLANLHKDTTMANGSKAISANAGDSAFKTEQPLFLNLYVMLGACFDAVRYQDSLRLLSHAVTCFQKSPVIDHHNYPGLSDDIEKLILEIENVSIHELSNLWSIFGGKYIPSILYRVRMVTIASNAIGERVVISERPLSSAGQR